MIYFDIETLALPDDKLELVKPQFKAPSNYKKPEAIASFIAEQEQEWKTKAALNPLAARVVLIGLLEESTTFLQSDNEAALLESFWFEWKRGERMAGFAIKGFDLPFLFRRSIINRVPVPEDLFEGRYWNYRFVDVQERWCCYSNRIEGQNLDAVCRACGLPGKNGSGSGSEFALLWLTDRDKALDYCQQDIECAASLGRLLGLDKGRPAF